MSTDTDDSGDEQIRDVEFLEKRVEKLPERRAVEHVLEATVADRRSDVTGAFDVNYYHDWPLLAHTSGRRPRSIIISRSLARTVSTPNIFGPFSALGRTIGQIADGSGNVLLPDGTSEGNDG